MDLEVEIDVTRVKVEPNIEHYSEDTLISSPFESQCKSNEMVQAKTNSNNANSAQSGAESNDKVANQIKKHDSITSDTKSDPDTKDDFDNLKLQRYSKNADDTFSCTKCKAQFKTPNSAARHYNAVHIRDAIRCEICHEELKSSKHYKAHMDRKHSRKFICPQCGKGFGQVSCFKTHFAIHLPKNERPFPCKTCGKRFTQSGALKVHMKVHSGVKDHFCRFCDRAFTDLGNMVNHERIHTKIKPYQCDLCGKAFSDPSAFKRHERTHTGEMKYSCKHCPKKFTDASGLIAHEVRHGKPKLSCKLCKGKFYLTNQLKMHVEAVHKKITRFECHHCGRKCYAKSNLAFHIFRMHKKELGIKEENNNAVLFTCAHCEMTTTSKFLLRRHIRELHGWELGLKPPRYYVNKAVKRLPKFMCEKCGKNYTTIHILNEHYATHHKKLYQCDFCKELYLNEKALKKHEATGCGKSKSKSRSKTKSKK